MAVFGLVSEVAGFLKVRGPGEKAVIDNLVFRCHYRFTSAVLFLGCLLCTANALIGPPIQCIYGDNDDKKQSMVNTYCWIMSTFTVPKWEGQEQLVGKHVPHRGVGPVVDEDEKRFHSYYQWVPFMLCLQGIMFYAPHWIWKNWEAGTIRVISDGVRGIMTDTREERQQRQSRLVRYLADSMRNHTWYAIGYYLCELLNFINVLANIFITDKFLGGNFLTYGLDATMFPGEEHNNFAMGRVFPRVTKCHFYTYGPGGSLQLQDTLCVLALNIINEKIYIFLWFWFIALAVMSWLAVLYSAAMLLVAPARKAILERRYNMRSPQAVEAIVSNAKAGDFLLLQMLGQNLNHRMFGDILNELSRELDGPRVYPKLDSPEP